MKLGDLCAFRNESVSVDDTDPDRYISTDSMLPNRGGIAAASAIPSNGKVRRYEAGDTLISNIRPYFKKIWQADVSGTCSADVLVFKPSSRCNSDYLYWLLSSDAFFDYVVLTSRGTKMPRGDKNAMLDFVVPEHDSHEQTVIVEMLNPIREKLALNQKTNDYLAA